MNEDAARERPGLEDAVPDEVTGNGTSHGKPASLRHGEQALARDLPGMISYAVEGNEEVFDNKDNPRTIDRAAVIGRDGRWVAGWALRFIIMVIAAWILWQGLSIIWAGLLPILLALLVSTVLWPITKFLRNRRWPAALAAITTILTFFLVIGAIFTAIAPSVASQSQQVYQRAQDGIRVLMDYLQGEPFNLDLSQLDGFLDDATTWLQDQSSNIASGVFTGFSAATTVLVTIVVMFVLTFFFLKDGVNFLPWLRKYTGETAGWHLTEVLSRSWNTLAGFIRTQALVSLVDAVFIGIGLLVLQVPMALALAVITFFAGFIPIVGAFTAGALAVIIALVTNGFTNALLVLGLIILVQQLEGNVLQPFLQGRAMQMHAAIVLLSVTIGSTLFGILGAFLAVPVAAVVAVWFRYHAEMVSLRSGEITVDDIKIETARGAGSSTSEAFLQVRERLVSIGRRKSTPKGSTAVSKKTLEEDEKSREQER